MKKTISIFLSIVTIISLLAVPTYAIDTQSVEACESTEKIEIPVLDVPENISDEEMVAYISDNGQRGIFVEGWATYALVRKGSETTYCDLIINWSGELASSFRCKKIEIKSTSFLFPKTYSEAGDGQNYRVRSFPASTHACVTYGQFSVPLDVDKATVHVKSGQMYILSSASWVSAAKSTYTTDIE